MDFIKPENSSVSPFGSLSQTKMTDFPPLLNTSTSKISTLSYGVFSHDVTAAILVSQNNETTAMLVSQTNPVGVELLSYANAIFCSNKFA